MKKSIAICVMIVLFTAGYAMADWTTIDFPGAYYTEVYDIDGSNIVGCYEIASGDRYGFLYNGTTWTTLVAPEARITSAETCAFGSNGSNIVGFYYGASGGMRGFLYNGTT